MKNNFQERNKESLSTSNQIELNKINESDIITDDENIKFNFNYFLHEILQKNILFKLNKNATLVVPGKIIRFSELIKKLCCSSNFDFKLTLETVDRTILEMIIEFFEILDWRLEDFFLELKSEDLKHWKETYKPYLKQIESTSKFLGINHILMYLYESDEFNQSKLR